MRGAAGSSRIVGPLGAFAPTRGAVLLVGLWACAEAVLLPVVPDLLLLPLVASAPRSALKLTVALIVGALVGTAVLAACVAANAAGVRSVLLLLPGVDGAMLARVQTDVGAHGLIPFFQLGPGVPLKVDTFAWSSASGAPLPLAAGVVGNRLTRLGPGIVIAALVGTFAPNLLRRYEGIALALYVLFWVALYAAYWGIV
jgi:hypothetical protein